MQRNTRGAQLAVLAMAVLFLAIGAAQGNRLDHMREAERFYRWVVSAATSAMSTDTLEGEKAAGTDLRPPVAKSERPATVRKGSGPKAGKADDLKAISGVGPKLEQALNGKGIFRFAEIARWTGADVEKIEAELGLDGRIARDGWVEQARALAKAKG